MSSYVVYTLNHAYVQEKKNRLSTEHQPQVITAWLSKIRDFYNVPSIIHPVPSFVNKLLVWYISLQPLSRKLKWDPMSSFVPPIGTLPDSPAEWYQLRKGGSNGIFLIVLALSWLPLYLTQADEKAKVDVLMTDLIWVLGVLGNRMYFDQATSIKGGIKAVQTKTGNSGKGKRKLAGDGSEVLRNSKKRKGV